MVCRPGVDPLRYRHGALRAGSHRLSHPFHVYDGGGHSALGGRGPLRRGVSGLARPVRWRASRRLAGCRLSGLGRHSCDNLGGQCGRRGSGHPGRDSGVLGGYWRRGVHDFRRGHRGIIRGGRLGATDLGCGDLCRGERKGVGTLSEGLAARCHNERPGQQVRRLGRPSQDDRRSGSEPSSRSLVVPEFFGKRRRDSAGWTLLARWTSRDLGAVHRWAILKGPSGHLQRRPTCLNAQSVIAPRPLSAVLDCFAKDRRLCRNETGVNHRQCPRPSSSCSACVVLKHSGNAGLF